jgi:hypothetical protein
VTSLGNVGFGNFSFSAAKFLGALAADGTISDLEGITSSGLDEKYNPLREQVEDSLKCQETLLRKIKVCK